MTYATFEHESKIYSGVIKDGKAYPLGTDLLSLIRGEKVNYQFDNGFPIEKISYKAPFQPFRNVFCVGKNYVEHAKEVSATKLDTQGTDMLPKNPVFFSKAVCPATGDGDDIMLSGVTERGDYEVELAIIIGKKAKNVAEKDAQSVIFGYTVLNDVTARDLQTKHGQWFLGKSADTFCPFGPVVVSADEIPYPPALNISCRVNGQTRQSSSTDALIFSVSRLIADITRGTTLFPGDVISTGTPSGIGSAMSPPVFLKAGDVVECEIEKIGILTNYCK
ncbi:hypothetical protein FACS189490_08720 [Clostridia bacterium]|nr:hypothetical protein FACS189490_08720 [Clostridia bacterium]